MSTDPTSAINAERAATLERAAALARQVDGLAEEQANTTHDDEHDPEGVTIGYQRAQLQGLLADARRDLGALDRAADRLRAGSYGRCARCGEPIAPARLEALPAAETCIGCAGRRR
ncbi:MAG: TraR/DksA family transcriptional regulator [Pseudonocardia sp.]|nr:TraR/DksA family transcriptional regulator [Pseudonocardia sp.]